MGVGVGGVMGGGGGGGGVRVGGEGANCTFLGKKTKFFKLSHDNFPPGTFFLDSPL